MKDRKGITRRQFLQSTTLAAATVLTRTNTTGRPSSARQRLRNGWEHYQGTLCGIWEVWPGEKVGDNAVAHLWHPDQMPHCFNARDAVDPDRSYCQGPGWYRIKLQLANPFPNGRTLLEFEGAGQKTEVFVSLSRVARHVGGYDEFVVDITEAAKARADSEVPVAVLCDSSRDLEMIPSDLSDFNLYGGHYRYVNLVYVPAMSLERILIHAAVEPGQPAQVSTGARLCNPSGLSDLLQLSVRVSDPRGSLIPSRGSIRKGSWSETSRSKKATTCSNPTRARSPWPTFTGIRGLCAGATEMSRN